MAAQILPIASGAANSADVTVADGSSLTVALKYTGGSAPAGALVDVLLKDDAGAYYRIDSLSPLQPALAIAAPGTYRFARVAGAACGVFSA